MAITETFRNADANTLKSLLPTPLDTALAQGDVLKLGSQAIPAAQDTHGNTATMWLPQDVPGIPCDETIQGLSEGNAGLRGYGLEGAGWAQPNPAPPACPVRCP